jgi:glycerate-2-kinase
MEGRTLLLNEREYDVAGGNIYVIGGGKASGKMAKAVEDVVGENNISQGIVVCNDVTIKTAKVKLLRGGHPLPDEEGIQSVGCMLESVSQLTPDDLVICLISGGGSALLTYPVAGVSLGDMKEITRLLLVSGADVYEINVIRKHLSQVAGGRLARRLQPARVLSLILSDTLDTQYDATASGPTLPDRSTFTMAVDLINKYRIREIAPVSIIDYLEKGAGGIFPETLKEGDPVFAKVRNIILSDNKKALETIRKNAAARGFTAKIISSKLIGDVKVVAERMAREIHGVSTGKNICLVAGGEPVVKVVGTGKGGRCQELAALMIDSIKDVDNCIFLAAGTDGSDFLPGVSGAMVDNETYFLARLGKVDIERFLSNNNTYELHKKLDNLILSTPTGTNVNDIMIFLLR